MDAFAASLCRGAGPRSTSITYEALRTGIALGSAQALMPLLGAALGIAFAAIIRDIDHWVAFVLLSFIGVRMVHAALSNKGCTT
ncbi:MAG: manganese efflux pump MntP family protein, partial [Burkholderiaceae bacterium]